MYVSLNISPKWLVDNLSNNDCIAQLIYKFIQLEQRVVENELEWDKTLDELLNALYVIEILD